MAIIGGANAQQGGGEQTTPTYAPTSDGSSSNTATNTNEGTTGAGTTGGDTAGSAASISTSSTVAMMSTSTGATGNVLTTTAASSSSASNTETESWMVCSKELATSTSLNMGALTFYHYVALAPEGDARKGILCGRLERSDGTAGWIGFGMSPDGEMDNGIGIIGLPSSSSDGGSGSVEKYWLSGENPFVERMSDDKQTLQFASITQNADDGSTVMEFAKFLNEEDELPILLADEGENTFLFALGGSNELGYHSSGMGSFTLALEASEASSSSTTGTTTTATSATTASTSFAIEGEFLFFLQCHHIYDCLFFYTYASNHSMIF
jgi:hypothetical protein